MLLRHLAGTASFRPLGIVATRSSTPLRLSECSPQPARLTPTARSSQKSRTQSTFMHRAVVEAAKTDQVGEPRLSSVGPMFDVMGIAIARATTGELTLIAIPTLQCTAQRGRDRARLAPDIKHCAVEGHDTAPPARHRRRRDAPPPRRRAAPCLLDHRLTGVDAGSRGGLATAACSLADLETVGALEPDGRFDQPLARVRAHSRCRRGRFRSRRANRARFRGNARGELSAAKRFRVHVHRYLVAITQGTRIEPARQRALGHQPKRIRAPLPYA